MYDSTRIKKNFDTLYDKTQLVENQRNNNFDTLEAFKNNFYPHNQNVGPYNLINARTQQENIPINDY